MKLGGRNALPLLAWLRYWRSAGSWSTPPIPAWPRQLAACFGSFDYDTDSVTAEAPGPQAMTSGVLLTERSRLAASQRLLVTDAFRHLNWDLDATWLTAVVDRHLFHGTNEVNCVMSLKSIPNCIIASFVSRGASPF
jgi:hypothetical protein